VLIHTLIRSYLINHTPIELRSFVLFLCAFDLYPRTSEHRSTTSESQASKTPRPKHHTKYNFEMSRVAGGRRWEDEVARRNYVGAGVKLPLTDIYVYANGEDLSKVYILIAGPEDSPYEGGVYCLLLRGTKDRWVSL